MIRKIEGRIEQRMHRITDDLVHHPTVLDDQRRNAFEVVIQHIDKRLGIGPVGQRGKSLHVGEQRRHLPALARELDQRRMLHDAPDNGRGQVLLETLANQRFAPLGHRKGCDGRNRKHRSSGQRRRQRINQAINQHRTRNRTRPADEDDGREPNRAQHR